MKSDRDLDSKTPRHNRQGLTPHEPPRPKPLHLSQNNNREERGPCLGMVPPHHLGSSCALRLASTAANSQQLYVTLALETSGNSWKGNSGNVGAMFG